MNDRSYRFNSFQNYKCNKKQLLINSQRTIDYLHDLPENKNNLINSNNLGNSNNFIHSNNLRNSNNLSDCNSNNYSNENGDSFHNVNEYEMG